MTDQAQNTEFCRKPQIFAESPLFLEVQALGGCRKPRTTADFCRKPKRLGSSSQGGTLVKLQQCSYSSPSLGIDICMVAKRTVLMEAVMREREVRCSQCHVEPNNNDGASQVSRAGGCFFFFKVVIGHLAVESGALDLSWLDLHWKAFSSKRGLFSR